MIPLEDNFADIIAKAQRGLGLADESLAAAAGVTLAELRVVKAERFDERVVRRLAAPLRLGADALATRGWLPLPVQVDGLAMFTTQYGGMTVNAFLAHDSRNAVAFDTGADVAPMLAFLQKRALKLALVLLTHVHDDHVGRLSELRNKTGTSAFASEREPVPGAETFRDGHVFRVGDLEVEARRTSGHTRGGTSYVVRGLSRLVVATGDALFAGSMGGAAAAYEEALRCNREQILTLPDEAVICPGHGPMTTVGEEKRHNPFFSA